MQHQHQIKAEQEKTELLSKMNRNLKEEKKKLELTMLQKAVTDLNNVKLKSKVRDRPFNLQGVGLWLFVSFRNIFFGQHES
jgi:hypothetical protein